MTDPRRLLDDDRAHPFSRDLLASASDDGLDRGRLAEIVRAATKNAPGGSPSEPMPPATSPAATSHTRSLLAKAPLIATVALLATGAFMVSRSEQSAPPAPSAPIAVAEQEEQQPPAARTEPSLEPTSAEALPVTMLPTASSAKTGPSATPPAPTPPPPAATAPPAASADPDRLMEEVRALERVSAAIARGNVVDARANLTTYERSFPKQLLASEARFLEIEILVAEDRHDKARERARAYLASWPESPYATRVRSLVSLSRP